MNILPYKLKTTKDQLTSRGGLVALGQLMQTLDFADSIDHYFPGPKSNRGLKPSEFIEALVLMQHDGRFHLDDVRHLQSESGLLKLLGMRRLPKATTLGDWLRRMGHDAEALKAWRSVNRRVLKAAYTIRGT